MDQYYRGNIVCEISMYTVWRIINDRYLGIYALTDRNMCDKNITVSS